MGILGKISKWYARIRFRKTMRKFQSVYMGPLFELRGAVYFIRQRYTQRGIVCNDYPERILHDSKMEHWNGWDIGPSQLPLTDYVVLANAILNFFKHQAELGNFYKNHKLPRSIEEKNYAICEFLRKDSNIVYFLAKPDDDLEEVLESSINFISKVDSLWSMEDLKDETLYNWSVRLNTAKEHQKIWNVSLEWILKKWNGYINEEKLSKKLSNKIILENYSIVAWKMVMNLFPVIELIDELNKEIQDWLD